MIISCPYCQLDTAGRHELSCPNRVPPLFSQIVSVPPVDMVAFQNTHQNSWPPPGNRLVLLNEKECRLLVAMLRLVEHKVTTWQAVCAAVDEFGHDSPAAGERTEIDDSAMRDIVTLADGMDVEWKSIFQILVPPKTQN